MLCYKIGMNNFRRRLMTDISISFIIISALIVGLVFFALNIKSDAKKIVEVRQELLNRSTSLKSFAFLSSQYNAKGKDYLQILNNVTPTYDQLIDLPKSLQSLAAKEDLGFGFTFTGETLSTTDKLGEARFTINLQGELFQFLNFIEEMDKMRFITSLDSFDLSGEDNKSQMLIVGRVFFN